MKSNNHASGQRQYFKNFMKEINFCPGQVAQVVGAFSCAPNGCRIDSLAGHILGHRFNPWSWCLWEAINQYFSLTSKSMSLSVSFYLSRSLPLPLKSIKTHPYDSDVGTFKVVLEVPKPLLIFLNSCFFILFWLNVYFFLLLQITAVSPSFFPSLLVPCIFFFISLCIPFTFSPILPPYLNISVSILITSVSNSASHRLAISSSLSSIFGAFIWAIFFFVSEHLRYSPGWGNPLCCVVVLYVGKGSEREQCCLLGSCLAFSHFPRTHK